MSEEDQQLVEEFQPFRHPAGEEKPHHLVVLQSLSNVDKHRVVHTTLVQTAGSQFRIYGLEDVSGIAGIAPQFGPLVDGAELARIGVVADGPEPRLTVDADLDLDIVFADEDSPVYDENVPTGCSAATASGRSSSVFSTRPSTAGAPRRWPRIYRSGAATVYETLRALRGAALLETSRPRRRRLAAGTDLADALRALIVVLKAEGAVAVERPARRRE